MTETYLAPLVGMHFRPPAKLVLAALPTGAMLIIEPEPDNAFDPDAVAVRAPTSAIPESQYARLEEELPGCGHQLEGVLASDTVHLGYCASAKNKKALPAGTSYISAARVGDLINSRHHQAKLAWGPSGEPLVELTVPTEAEEEARLEQHDTFTGD